MIFASNGQIAIPASCPAPGASTRHNGIYADPRPTPLRAYTDKQASVSVEASTVAEGLAALIAAQREARKQGLDIVGFYHSHPDHPAQWSPTDFAEAHWFGCAYVITATAKGHAEITNSFLLTGTGEDDKAFTNQSISITAAP